MEYTDLHIHSSYSDGLLSPEEIIRFASAYRLRAVSITDHDTFAGLPEANAAGKKFGIQVVPGIEISTKIADYTVHLLGYFFDITDPVLIEYVNYNRFVREERAKKIVARLNDLGMKISFELVKIRANNGVIGRPHIADVMLEEGYVYSFRDAFEKYLGENKAAYIQKPTIEPEEGIKMVHNAGGLVFIAHPAVEITDAIIKQLITQGLDGLEVYHPKHLQGDIDHYMQLVQTHDLLVCGGSDCHGPRNSNDLMLGTIPVPFVYLEQMKSRLAVAKIQTLY